MPRMASCVCGDLRVSCANDPAMVSLCHCLACQKRTGNTFGIAARFERTNVGLIGKSRTYTRQADSGVPVTFHFCPDCGSTVYWEPQRMPDLVAVAVGSFADPAFPATTKAVYSQFRHPWVKEIT